MQLQIIVPGRIKEKYIQDGVADYLKRLRRYNKAAEIVEVKIKGRSGAPDKDEEGQQLMARLASPTLLVGLDPHGKSMSSEEFAAQCEKWQNLGEKRVSFIIGGPTGLSAEVRQRADLLLSLSPMTFTHDMARLLLVEQLYRSYAIMNGSQYHK